MKRFVAMLILLLLSVSMLGTVAGCAETTEKLYVYNWADYIGIGVEEDFEAYYEEKYGKKIDIVYSTFDTNETMLSKLLNGDAEMDVVCPSEYAIQKLILEDMLLSYKPSESIASYANVDPDIIARVDGAFGAIQKKDGTVVNMNDYFVPYMWGTLGILYNEKYVTEADLAEGWGLMWNANNNPNLEGKILMKDSIRDAYAVAVGRAQELGLLPATLQEKTAEELINTATPEVVAVVSDLLEEQRQILQGYEVDFGKDDMIRERAYVCLAWSGDAMWAIEDSPEDVPLNYVTPGSCVNVWFDGWVIPKTTRNERAAKEFVDFMTRTDIGIRNSIEIVYTSALSKEALIASEGTDYDAIALLIENEYDPEEYFADEIRYPDIFDARFGMMRDFGANNRAVVSMWERVKVTDNSTDLIIITAVCAGVVALFVAGVMLVQSEGQASKD